MKILITMKTQEMSKNFEKYENKPLKQIKFMSDNFDADAYVCAGELNDPKLIEKYAFISMKGDLLTHKRPMINEGDAISIVYKYRDGNYDIVKMKYYI